MRTLATALLILLLAPNLWAEGFGYESVGGNNNSIENNIWANRASPASSGTLDSMKVYLNTTTATHNVKGAVYLWSDTSFVDSTEIIAVGTGAAWVYFDFVNNASITASTEYAIAVWSEAADGDCVIYFDLGGGSSAQGSATYGVWFTPKWTGVENEYGSFPISIYAYYTPVAAAGQVIIINTQ